MCATTRSRPRGFVATISPLEGDVAFGCVTGRAVAAPGQSTAVDAARAAKMNQMCLGTEREAAWSGAEAKLDQQRFKWAAEDRLAVDAFELELANPA
jgi:hypothetical protein